MISDMLKIENIQIMDHVSDWKTAIHISLEPLIRGGYVTDNYEQSIIQSTNKYGPYYVLAEEFALIHGRPEDGVVKKQLAITLLREPIQFTNDSFPVRILIALAASDSNSHLDTMKVLSSIFMNEMKTKEIVGASSPQEIYDLLIQAEEHLE